MNHLDAEKLRQSPANTSAPARRPAPTPSRAVADNLDLATRPNTRRSYAAALRHFEIEWGGLLPATADGVIHYLAAYGGALSLASLRLHLSALSRWHRDQGFTDPTKAPQVRQVLRGIGTAHPQPSRQARPLQIEELQRTQNCECGDRLHHGPSASKRRCPDEGGFGDLGTMERSCVHT